MTTFTRSADGAAAYSRTNILSTVQPLEDLSGFSAENQDSPARRWWPVIDQLLRLRTLEDDWDGEGTLAPHPALVDGAITLARYLQDKGVTPPDRVHASVNATVYFEWHAGHAYCEIEIVSPVEAECRSVRKGSSTTEVLHLSRKT